MRCFVWRWGKENESFKVFVFTRVHYSDRPADVMLEETKKIALKEGELQNLDHTLTTSMQKGSYVDDSETSGAKEDLNRMIRNEKVEVDTYTYDGTSAQLLYSVGLQPKVIVRSGKKDPRKVEKL